MIINLEAQNEFRKYIVKRGFVYCARMISSQIRKEFSPPHYELVKKVVSIWLCFDPPKYAKDTITSFKISQNDLIKMLSTALSGNLSSEEKINMLESEYNMEMASEMEVKDMCNYSEYIENLGIKKGRAELEPVLEKKDAEIQEKDAVIKQKDAVIGAQDIELATLKALLISNNIPFSQSK